MKPVKAWMVMMDGELSPHAFIGKSAKDEAQANALAWKGFSPLGSFEPVEVLIFFTPIPPKRKGRRK